jgi:SAM-dependent methyltransferase
VTSVHDARPAGAFGDLTAFRREFYDCLTARADALFELADAVLCADGPVHSLVDLSLVGEHRRGHGALYDALASGRMDVDRLRTALTTMPLPRASDGRLVLAVDITCWLRPLAHTSPQRILCHTYGRAKDAHLGVPGWPYSIVVALEPGRSSWTAPVDAIRLAPGDDGATVTADQLREIVGRLVAAGQWHTGDPHILVTADAGYDLPRLAHLLRDLPVQVVGRMRSDRVLRRAVPPRTPGTYGRPPRHGGEFVFGDPNTWGPPSAETVTQTRLYGTATAMCWDRLHPRLTHRAAWLDSGGPLPLIEGTVILLRVAHLPSGAIPKPFWLWWSGLDATPDDVDRLWQTYLRRFDIEHTFHLFKQTLGWTAPKIRTPQAADRWTWLILAAYTQLRLARRLALIYAAHGRNPPHPNGSPPPGSVETFGTYARISPVPLPHRNPPDQDRADHPAAATTTARNVTTSTSSERRPANPGRRNPNQPIPAHAGQVKKQGNSRPPNAHPDILDRFARIDTMVDLVDVPWTAQSHLRFLLSTDRGHNVQRAVRSAVRPGDRVLDAGTGSGILSFIALKAGAGAVVAVDHKPLDLAAAIAQSNGLADRVTWVRSDLNELRLPEVGDDRPFDVLLAFIYTNHIVVDEGQSRLVFALRDRFGADACRVVPGSVRYRVAGCDRGDWDLPTEVNDLHQAADILTGCYGLDFGPLIEAARVEAPVRYSRPPDPGMFDWRPGTTMASVRFPRNHIRLLTDFEDFTTVDYTAQEFEGFPRHAPLTVANSGRLTGVIWQQELIHDGHSLWSTETYSPLAQPCVVSPTQRLELEIDDTWRATNVISHLRYRETTSH